MGVRPSRYPKAEWLGNGHSGGSYTSGPWKVVLHTTETEGIPGYASGKTAPHVTYYAAERRWVQHTSFLTAARALKNESGGVQTNRDSALQVEIVCYSAKNIAEDDPTDRIWVGDLSGDQLEDIRAFLLWAQDNFGVEMKWPGKQAFSYSQASDSFRMDLDEWNSFDGVCGHQHVPENDHWDPGALAWNSLMQEETEDMLTAQDVWYHLITDPVTGDRRGAQALLAGARGDAYKARVDAAVSRRVVEQIAADDGNVQLSPEDIAAISAQVNEELEAELAEAVANEIKERMES